jgi:hypothetical protein
MSCEHRTRRQVVSIRTELAWKNLLDFLQKIVVDREEIWIRGYSWTFVQNIAMWDVIRAINGYNRYVKTVYDFFCISNKFPWPLVFNHAYVMRLQSCVCYAISAIYIKIINTFNGAIKHPIDYDRLASLLASHVKKTGLKIRDFW